MKRIFNHKSWLLILGIGIGVAAGVVLASGIEFDKAESAKFVGAMLGSIIAVSGAVALHYLKEAEARNDRRRHLVALLRTTHDFGSLAIADLQKRIEVGSTCDTYREQFLRALRFSEKYEFEDYAISEVNSYLTIHSMSHLKCDDDEDIEDDHLNLLIKIIQNSLDTIQNSLDAIGQADRKLKEVK